MDAVASSGPVMTTIGVGAVFVALSLLIAVVVATSRAIDRRENGKTARPRSRGGAPGQAAAGPGPGAASGSTGAPGASETPAAGSKHGASLLLVALAAYGLHRGKGITVRKPQPSSPWGAAGRTAQLTRLSGGR